MLSLVGIDLGEIADKLVDIVLDTLTERGYEIEYDDEEGIVEDVKEMLEKELIG